MCMCNEITAMTSATIKGRHLLALLLFSVSSCFGSSLVLVNSLPFLLFLNQSILHLVLLKLDMVLLHPTQLLSGGARTAYNTTAWLLWLLHLKLAYFLSDPIHCLVLLHFLSCDTSTSWCVSELLVAGSQPSKSAVYQTPSWGGGGGGGNPSVPMQTL